VSFQAIAEATIGPSNVREKTPKYAMLMQFSKRIFPIQTKKKAFQSAGW